MASLLCSNIQDFVQAPPVFKVLEGEKGEVKPPKCPTRQSGLADTPYLGTLALCGPIFLLRYSMV